MNLKKFFSFISVLGYCLLILCPLTTRSLNSDNAVVGTIYSTDIVAYIDDMPIRSYNTGGNTAILVEDLANFGFDVRWDSSDRSFMIYTLGKKPTKPPKYTPIENKKPRGTAIGSLYTTDIHVIINGVRIPAYVIDEKAVILAEDLVSIKDSSAQIFSMPSIISREGYSIVGFQLVWNADKRTISLYAARDIEGVITTDIGDVKIINKIKYDGSHEKYNECVYRYYFIKHNAEEIVISEPGVNVFTMWLNLKYPEHIEGDRYINLNDLKKYVGLNFSYDDGTLDIRSDNNVIFPLEIVAAQNEYNSIRDNLYELDVNLALDGKIVATPLDMYTLILNASSNELYINIRILEEILSVNVF